MRASLRRIRAVAAKEVLHVVRDSRSLYLALGMPVVLLLLFGFGVSFDMDHLPVAIVDEDRSQASAALARHLGASGELELVRVEGLSSTSVERAFETRQALGVVLIPRGFEESLRNGRARQVQVLLDGVDANSATQLLAKLEAIVRGASSSSLPAPLEVRVRSRFNPENRSALFLVPGLTAYVVALVCVLLTALTVAREFERGSIVQLATTPLRPGELILGKLLPYLALGALVVMLVLATGAWVFAVPLRGSFPALALASLLFLAGMLGQGLLISVVARSQMVATQVATLTSMLPTMLLSGFMFPIENMPLPLRALSNLVPARYYIHALRGVLLRGNDVATIRADLLALAVFATVVLGVATARFPRRLT